MPNRAIRELGIKSCPYMILLGLFYSSVNLANQSIWLSLNTSTSLPERVFLIRKHQAVQRGDYVAFYPPANPLYPSDKLFIKLLIGMPQDKVSVVDHQVWVNGQWIGKVQPFSQRRVPLHACASGVLGKNQYFVYTPHRSSFDSRYRELGWIEKNRFIGRAYPLF